MFELFLFIVGTCIAVVCIAMTVDLVVDTIKDIKNRL